MASYVAPTADQIIKTGLNQYIQGHTEAEFQEWLESLVQDAEDECALEVTESAFDATTWTARQARQLTRAVSYYTAAIALVSPELEKVTGTQAPVVMEDAEDIADVAERMRRRGKSLLGLVKAGVSEEPVALPSVGASTFDVTTDDRTPSEKNQLQDERDDVGAWNTDEG